MHILCIWGKLYKKWLKNTHTKILNRSSFHACIRYKICFSRYWWKKKNNQCTYSQKSSFSHLKKKKKIGAKLCYHQFIFFYLLIFLRFYNCGGLSENGKWNCILKFCGRGCNLQIVGLTGIDSSDPAQIHEFTFCEKFVQHTDQAMSRYSLFIINKFIYLHCVSFHWISLFFFLLLLAVIRLLVTLFFDCFLFFFGICNADCFHSFYCTLKRRRQRLIIHIDTVSFFYFALIFKWYSLKMKFSPMRDENVHIEQILEIAKKFNNEKKNKEEKT